GKVDNGETPETAVLRELFEETGYRAVPNQLEFLDEHRFFMPSGTVNDFASYRILLDAPHDVVLEDTSHSAFRWVSPGEAYALPDLMYGMEELFQRVGLSREL